jgi:predicted metallopeptidase
MTATRNGDRLLAVRPFDRAYHPGRPLPVKWVLPDGRKPPAPVGDRPLDFTAAARRLCGDVVARCPTFAHIDMANLLVTFTPCRNRSKYGLQARVTPMRFRDGTTVRRLRGVPYGVQRYSVNGQEVLYVVTFCLPRFLDQPFPDKLTTVFHELYHIGPAFDGDLRRHPGRYQVHSHSKRAYDDRMRELVTDYLATNPDPELFAFLKYGYADLWKAFGGLYGVVVPRPKLLPLAWRLPVACSEAMGRG